MSIKLNLTIKKGSTYSRALLMTRPIIPTPATPPLSTAVDVTLDSFLGQIKTSYTTTNITASFTFVKDNAAGGAITMSLAPTVTKLLVPGRKYYYDVDWIKENGDNVPILEGTIKVTPEVSQEVV